MQGVGCRAQLLKNHPPKKILLLHWENILGRFTCLGPLGFGGPVRGSGNFMVWGGLGLRRIRLPDSLGLRNY